MKKPQPDYCETATLTYVLPDAKGQLMEALNASHYHRILSEIHEKCVTVCQRPHGYAEGAVHLAEEIAILVSESEIKGIYQ